MEGSGTGCWWQCWEGWETKRREKENEWWRKNLVLRVCHKVVFLIRSKGTKLTFPWWEITSLFHTKCHPSSLLQVSNPRSEIHNIE
jgi:hypothetical protein